jgi:hypothetical protein
MIKSIFLPECSEEDRRIYAEAGDKLRAVSLVRLPGASARKRRVARNLSRWTQRIGLDPRREYLAHVSENPVGRAPWFGPEYKIECVASTRRWRYL